MGKAWNDLHKDQIKAYNRKRHLALSYGLTERDVERILQDQESVCPICQKPIGTPNVDHNPITNKVRGVLCWDCNIGLGKFNHNTGRLIRAATYLAWTDDSLEPPTWGEAKAWKLDDR